VAYFFTQLFYSKFLLKIFFEKYFFCEQKFLKVENKKNFLCATFLEKKRGFAKVKKKENFF